MTEPSSGGLALVGATVLAAPDAEPAADAVLVIEGDRIAAMGRIGEVQVPADVAVVDCAGTTVTAAFQNSHVHFFERKWAGAGEIPAEDLALQLREEFTRFGFTSAFDTGSAWENTRTLRDRIESGEVPGPRIRSTGEALVAPGAVPADPILAVLGFAPFPAPEIATAAEAAAATRRLLERGVDGVKVHLQPPPPPGRRIPDDAMARAVSVAHAAQKPVFAHPATGADIDAAVEAGVDVIAHTTPLSGPWPEELLVAMKQAEVAVTPTLTLWRSVLRHDRVGARRRAVDAAVAQLHDWAGRGGAVLFGTDQGAVDADPSEEYRLMSRAGLSGRDILASLTTAPAERFGEGARRGRIGVGMAADLVVLRGDPTLDPTALASVAITIRAGRVVYRDD